MDYVSKMRRLENLCAEYEAKANREYVLNDYKHSSEECRWLQEAIDCEAEMARISQGEERRHHQRRLQDLDSQIRSIVKILEPNKFMDEGFEDKESKKSETKPNRSTSNNDLRKNSNGNVTEKKDRKNWFKPAPKHSFEDVSGMEDLKERLKKCIEDSRLVAIRRYLKLKNLHSYFFIGMPGCGKTYVIEAFAHELMDQNYKYLSLDGSDILSKYVGDAEKIVTGLFEEAEKNAPCIVFIDEIESVCKNRSIPNLPEYASSITTSFLTGYNRINASDKEIIFIGATNYPNRVDNAMLDRVEVIRVNLPDLRARAHAFEHALSEIIKLENDLTYEKMAELTPDYNYRDIERVVERVKGELLLNVMKKYSSQKEAIQALQTGEFKLTLFIFEEVIRNYQPSPKEEIRKELDDWEKKFRENIDL